MRQRIGDRIKGTGDYILNKKMVSLGMESDMDAALWLVA